MTKEKFVIPPRQTHDSVFFDGGDYTSLTPKEITDKMPPFIEPPNPKIKQNIGPEFKNISVPNHPLEKEE